MPDPETLRRAIEFVDECDTQHSACTHRERPEQMPSRLLDVGPPGAGDVIRLVEIDAGVKARYVTLSYCWGDNVGHFTTTRATASARKDGIIISELPKTFRDAIIMARALKVRYLWIDSLCICQDDHKDWERESARMAAVYTNAYLTLAATGSRDCNTGLFHESSLGPFVPLPYQTPDGVHASVWTYALQLRPEVVTPRYVDMDREPLSQRGWAFQERVLSRRLRGLEERTSVPPAMPH